MLCLIGAVGCLLAMGLSSYEQLQARPVPLLTILGLILLVFMVRPYILKRISS